MKMEIVVYKFEVMYQKLPNDRIQSFCKYRRKFSDTHIHKFYYHSLK